MSTTDKKKSTLREYIEAFAIAIILALFIRTFIIQAFKIPSGSMLPTLKIGDHLLVNKFIYGIKIPFSRKTLVPISTPEHNDVIVFIYPKDRSKDYIKRVIALPGDTLQIRNKKVFINGTEVEDKHAHFADTKIYNSRSTTRDNYGPIVIPDGKVFVMGDNRDNSYDSRFWGFVDQKDILGKALIIYWSWDTENYKWFDFFERVASIRWGRLADIIH